MKEILAKINKWLHDDKELLYVTIALVVVGGLVRTFDLGASRWLLLFAFVPYFVMRSRFYYTHRRREWTTVEKQRFIVLLLLLGAILMNFLTLAFRIFPRFRAEFLILFLLLTDYLFVVNQRKEDEKEE